MFIGSLGTDSPSFANCKLLLPCISVGNVGQLSVDVIVNSLRLPRVGYLDHPAILPLVGNDAFDHTHPAGFLHTAAEVYYGKEQGLAVVQLRTPLVKRLRGSFCAELLKWVKAAEISEVVVLTSSHAHERRDSQIRGEQFRFLLSSSASDLYPHLTEQLQWNTLEPRPSPSALAATSDDKQQGTLDESLIFLPGAGVAKRLYTESNLLGVRLVVVVAFCTQGDNIEDGLAMASRLDDWLDLSRKEGTNSSQWICPSSWSMMYGRPSPSNLF